MIKAVIPASALLIGGLAYAFAAGGGGAAGGAAGAAGRGGGHAPSSFGKPGVGNNPFPGVTARPGCVGGITGATSTGAIAPNAPPSLTSPSPTNGSAVKGPLQSTPDLPRLSAEDHRILNEIKQANEKLGQVGNPGASANGQRTFAAQARPAVTTDNRQTGTSGRSTTQPITQLPPARESIDTAALQGKPDLSRQREREQRLARDTMRSTEKMGNSGSTGNLSGVSGLPSQGDEQSLTADELRRQPTVPHRPLNTMGTASGSPC